jgi:hypothetical protein
MMERGQTTWSSEPLLPWRVVLCVFLEHMIIDLLSAACYSSGVLPSISRCCPYKCGGMHLRFWLESDMCRRSRNTLTCAGILRPIFSSSKRASALAAKVRDREAGGCLEV